jgi:hypothetical protein
MGVELVNTNVEGGVGIEMAGLAGSGAVRVMEVGWPSGAALRGVVSNHRALRPLTAVRGERHGKRRARGVRQVWIGKMSGSELSVTCRNPFS